MNSFKWSKAHAVYLAEIDAEHRNLFRLADEFQKAVIAGDDPAHLVNLLRTALSETEAHFNHEERLMRSIQYPLYNWHKQQHDTVRKRAGECLKGLECGDLDAAPVLLEFL